MVSSRKRGREQMEAIEPLKEPSLLERIRNMWEFANLVQWIFIFGKAVKIDEDLDVEELEMECLKTHSTVLPEIGLALLKFVSSHRGLTPEIFDEYTRRQYVAKAPHRNPFGVEEEPAKFAEFDIFTKIRVLQQLTQWTMGNPDRIRERMEEQRDTEQTIWRIEPYGWDAHDRTYFLLDDNRLYRRTDPPPPPLPAAKPKRNSKKGKAARRASKRRKVSEPAESDPEPAENADTGDEAPVEKEDDAFGGMKWECLAVTFDEVNTFLASLQKSRDPNEKVLWKRLSSDLLPILEKQEETRKRKAAQRERELLNLEKLASAKRSSRIAGKLEHQKQEEEAREAERKRLADLAMAKKEQERWMKLEKERESRMMTREQRLKEREARRILHEEELANLSEDNKKLEAGAAAGRLSERHLKAEIERKKQALEELAEEEDWIFDCICGAYGQIDDGTHSIACDKCNIWQHSKCVGVSQAEADRDDFSFICKTCERRARDAERAKTHPPIKIRLNRPGSSSSPIPPKQNGSLGGAILPNPAGSEHASHYQGAPQATVQQAQSNVPQMTQWQKPYNPQQSAIPGLYSSGSSYQRTPSAEVHTNAAPPTAPRQSPYDNGIYSTQSTLPASAQALSSPQGNGGNGPTNLTHPTQAYSFINGSPSQHDHRLSNPPQAQPTPTPLKQDLTGSHPFSGTSPSLARPSPNGQQALYNTDHNRRGSINLPSPFSETPILTPRTTGNQTASFPINSSPPISYTPSVQSTKFSPQPVPTPSKQVPPSPQNHEPSHASILPPTVTGYSPTKHSPPRPTTSNGSLNATPSSLPPVATLSPSPQVHNLAPPVKPSEPERNRESQSVGS